MNQKLLLFSIIPVVFTLGIVSSSTIDETFFELNGVEESHAKVMEGHIQLIVSDEDGNVKQIIDKKNLIVGEGLKTAWDLVFLDINNNSNSTDSEFGFIGIGDGNTAAAATDTGLQTPISGCGLLEDGTVTGGGTNTLTWAYVSVQFSGATCASATVSEAVLTNSLSGGEVLARQVFSDINLGAADTLTVNWNVTLADDGV